nr:proto-oncogene Mas-like isoform X1 [Pogona vitticeps]XP_020664793.1 proto-oncogene Mas-like isoform X1 [Pogona vitticeps]XP_020664801.1 proto-oncogene Mas-like isoform X1 [Pogona vitticeps]XP_020664808.1 proto-oncogene Mas-like isoform X1 [Pogona vitticeps]XP_020664816.1 proto-oncogene Mas-like isoform X1 [Pogona vitticeps]XP_020664823.1 proto-oncogene Mas-like isoform X1 [Pogona vitticeps]
MMTEKTALSSHTAVTIKKNYTQLETWPKKGYFPGTRKGYFLETVVVVSVSICLCGLIGNGVIFWFLCTRIKRTRFTIYIFNLVAADLAVLVYYILVFILFVTPFYVDLYFSRIMENIYSFVYNSSIYFLTAISTERCLMVFIPTRYQHQRPKHLSKIVCAILWALSCLVSLVVYISCYPRFLSSHSEGSFYCDAATVFEMTINLFIFLPVMFFTTLILFVRVQKNGKQSCSEKFDITVIVMVFLFFIFASSVRIIDAIAYWDQRLDAPIPFLLSLLFDSIKSSANPFVYLFVGNWKRKKIQEPNHIFLENALKYKENMTEPPQIDQKQASRHPRPQT